MDYSDYQDLGATGYADRKPTDPKDEFFHSVYIAGVTRTNQENISEEAGKLQIRGVEYNKDMIHMIITHTKQVLVKTDRDAQSGRETVKCFSFQQGPPPWHGTHQNHQCGTNSAERAADPWCQQCRAQMIVAGILCDASGQPVKKEDGKPTFVFLRGKGMKYAPIADYLSEMAGLDLEPFFEPQTEESKRFEKAVVNNKRFVASVNIDEVPSNYGPKKVFKLTAGIQIPNEAVAKILELAKKSLDKFNEKFNWTTNSNQASAGYSPQAQQGGNDGLMQVDDAPPFGGEEKTPQNEGTAAAPDTTAAKPSTEKTTQPTFSFEDLDF